MHQQQHQQWQLPERTMDESDVACHCHVERSKSTYTVMYPCHILLSQALPATLVLSSSPNNGGNLWLDTLTQCTAVQLNTCSARLGNIHYQRHVHLEAHLLSAKETALLTCPSQISVIHTSKLFAICVQPFLATQLYSFHAPFKTT